ncbi:non-ribosomal peptide synthetase [Streptomyces sp. SID13031]|nr:non-ribosomal peptide synthetase [Streptomyces sp. SID13031]NEA33590.1 non-ribosomal peptide synthetase [Streptomyces sp. SID13031]
MPPLAGSAQGFAHQRILQVGAANPQATALSTTSGSWTYREVIDAVRRTARELTCRGVGPERVVAVRAERSPSTIVAMLATLQAGGAYVPIDESMPPDMFDELADRLGVMASISGTGGIGLAVHGTSSEEPDIRGAQQLAPANLAYIILTSGSTGSPKAVGVEHRNLWHSTIARDRYQKPPEKFRILMTMSPSFDGAVYSIYWTLMHGGELVIPSTEELLDPIALGQLMADRPVDYLSCVPSFYSLLIDTVPPEAMQSVVQVALGGDVLTAELVARHRQAVPRARLVNEYGPSECTLWCTRYEVPDTDTTGDPVPIGRPIPGATAQVSSGHSLVAPGRIGELYIGGNGVGRGYIGNPRETALRFLPDRYGDPGARVYRSGDLVSQSDQGQLVFHGRIDDEVKVRDHRINLGMIEAAFRRLDNVQDAAVVKEREGESAYLLAFIVYSDDETARDDKAVLERVSEMIPGYMLPQRVISVHQIPRNDRGKVERQRVRSLAGELGVRVRTDRESVAQVVMDIVRKALGREPFGPDSDLFQEGLTSLHIARVVAALGHRYDLRLKGSEIFEVPTVNGMAAVIVQAADSSSSNPGPADPPEG